MLSTQEKPNRPYGWALLDWGRWVNTGDPAAAKQWQWRRQVLLVLAGTLILGLRDWEKLWQPRFIAEDGVIFFAEAYNLSPWQAITTPYAGYYHLIPRLVAETGMLLPFAAMPLFYAVSTLLLTSSALTWFALPHFRYLIRSDGVRIAFVLLLLLLPNVGALMQLAYVQWYLAVWALFVAWMPTLPSRWGQGLLAGLYLLVIFTAPVLLIWLPIWLIRWWAATTRSQRASLGLIVAAQLACLLAVWWVPPIPGGRPTDLGLALADVTLGLFYQVFVLNLLGQDLSRLLFAYGGWITYGGLGLAALGWILVLGWRQRDPRLKLTSYWLLYIIVGAAALYGQRAALFRYMFVQSLETMHQDAARYFWISGVAFLLLLFILTNSWPAAGPAPGRADWRIGLYGGLLLCYGLAFRLPWAWGTYIPWQPTAQLLTALQANHSGADLYQLQQVGADGGLQPVSPVENLVLHIAIAPEGWTLYLQAPRSAAIYTFPAGPTLLSIHSQRQGPSLQVELTWQGETAVPAAPQLFYTAYVHLVDKERNRLAGADVLLEPTRRDANGEPLVFQSQHWLELPANLTRTDYDFAIGLYHFQGDQLVNGPAIFALQPGTTLADN